MYIFDKKNNSYSQTLTTNYIHLKILFCLQDFLFLAQNTNKNYLQNGNKNRKFLNLFVKKLEIKNEKLNFFNALEYAILYIAYNSP